ncbi:mannonate dehydratase [Gammaproteobacteria bacterium]|nr:mannonate dehydratase [Gammaproteobacteria bacterium]
MLKIKSEIKIGFGLYRHMLDDAHLRFAKQLGATHIIVHLCDYFNKNTDSYSDNQPIGDSSRWGIASGEIWSIELLQKIKTKIEQHGLVWYAIENFDPKHWNYILFNDDRDQSESKKYKKYKQFETIKQIISNVGSVGIPVFGYNFSLTGVTGRIIRNDVRGNAQTVGMDGINDMLTTPLPKSMAWNMTVDPDAKGIHQVISEEQLWRNLNEFLAQIIPVAEASNVIMAAHPDDPPLENVRGLPKLINQPDKFQRLLDCYLSEHNKLEYCLGTISEMTQGDVYETTKRYALQDKIAYVHLRNVIGKVPHYKEVFIDEGDINIKRIIQILEDAHFKGVLIPDHSPQMSGGSPWYTGMAFAMGYINALVKNNNT